MIRRTVGYLHRPTVDGRMLTGIVVENRLYPVFSNDGEMLSIGSAKIQVGGIDIVAEITLAAGIVAPSGYPVIELRPGETSTNPMTEDVNLFEVTRRGRILMTGVLNAVVYVDNPAWPELKR